MSMTILVDGVNIFNTYGAFVTSGGLCGLVGFPSLKSVNYNDWYEEDGIEPDLSNPVLDSKQFNISFGFTGTNKNARGFIDSLYLGTYHTFTFSDLGKTKTLRLVSVPAYDVLGERTHTATLTFADDYPLAGYTRVAPSSSIPQNTAYLLDGVSLTAYGIYVLYGTYESIKGLAAPKTTLVRNIRTVAGASADAMIDSQSAAIRRKFQSRTAEMYLYAQASSMSQFWQNMDCFLYDMTRANVRKLKASDSNVYDMYYNGCEVSSFDLVSANKITCEFTLGITLTGGVTPYTED